MLAWSIASILAMLSVLFFVSARRTTASGAFADCWGGTASQADGAGGFVLTRTVPGRDAGCFFYASGDRERFPLDAHGTTRLKFTARSRANGAFYAVKVHFWNGNTFIGETDWLVDEMRTGLRVLEDVEGWGRAHDCINVVQKVRCLPATAVVLQFRIQPLEFSPSGGLPAFTFADVRVRAGG